MTATALPAAPACGIWAHEPYWRPDEDRLRCLRCDPARACAHDEHEPFWRPAGGVSRARHDDWWHPTCPLCESDADTDPHHTQPGDSAHDQRH